ncbi:hypothetical protein [Nonomuraea sp. NPDC049480]|uniref:hypothetical protein n=1 Tax=Nonomuraea sp. NPDC049480 TaxID=3364353 RepID=UPI003791FCCD
MNQLEQAFNGDPKLLGAAVGTMYRLNGQADALMLMTDEDGTTAGPTFDYVPPEQARNSLRESGGVRLMPGCYG